jgi:3-oxoadipate enol-lactonase
VRAVCRDIEVAWAEWGRGDPLVLVHGLAEDHRAWRKVLPSLVLRRRVIAYDLRGHGETTLGQTDGTLAQLAGDLVALLDAAGLERADLCGFSLGGTVVMRVAIDRPERVGRLVPLATSSRVGKAAAAWYRERARLAEEGGLEAVLEQDTREQLAGAGDEVADQWAVRQQSVADSRGFANACRAMARLADEPLDPELPRVQAPTLVVAGELDPLCPPRAAEIIAARIPGARLRIVPGSGHLVAIERPAEVSRAVLSL